MAVCPEPMPRGCSTICLRFDNDLYDQVIGDPPEYRRVLERFFEEMPELFPRSFASGYPMKDDRTSVKLGLRLRRICCKVDGSSFTIRPSFAMPYMTGWTEEASDPLFLRSFGGSLLGHRPRLRQGSHVLVAPGSQPGVQQHRRDYRPPGGVARAPAGR